MFGNRQKSLGAKSGEYGRCDNNSNFNSGSFVNGFFFSFIGPAGSIITPNMLYLLFVLFLSNQWRWSFRIIKNRSHHLAGRFYRLCLLRDWFTWCCRLFRLSLRLRHVKMDPSVINSDVSTQELTRIAMESVTRLRLFSTVSKIAPILPTSFL